MIVHLAVEVAEPVALVVTVLLVLQQVLEA
jgi:hypothetical protein